MAITLSLSEKREYNVHVSNEQCEKMAGSCGVLARITASRPSFFIRQIPRHSKTVPQPLPFLIQKYQP